MLQDLSSLYPHHLDVLMQRSAEALRRAGREHLLIAAGIDKYQFLDDRPYPFNPNPHFKHWLPLLRHPNSWLVITPGKRPRIIYYQPADYWHVQPAAPSGYWVEHFDIDIVRCTDEIPALLPDSSRCAIVGEGDAALPGYAPDNATALLNYLHWHRGCKTPYEIELMRQAQRRAVRGHRAAESAFRRGASEREIHLDYLVATGHGDFDLPYNNIIGLNEHGAVLHYQYQDAERPAEARSFLIDAGASVSGYAADITRSYAGRDAAFGSLIDAVEQVQLALVEQVRSGTDYAEIHLDSHRQLAGVLQSLDLVRMAPEAMVESGVSCKFYPHGIGHLIGMQVHDVAGFQRDEDGGTTPKPVGHAYLRLTRRLLPGMAVTIEPGIYFIDLLLDELRQGPNAGAVNWNAIEHFRRFGGVRIEDDVVCTEGAPENLTRDAFAACGVSQGP